VIPAKSGTPPTSGLASTGVETGAGLSLAFLALGGGALLLLQQRRARRRNRS
jgi:hypothetical protein